MFSFSCKVISLQQRTDLKFAPAFLNFYLCAIYISVKTKKTKNVFVCIHKERLFSERLIYSQENVFMVET